MKHIKAAGAGKGNDMWVSSKEIAEAKEEGINFLFKNNIVEIK